MVADGLDELFRKLLVPFWGSVQAEVERYQIRPVEILLWAGRSSNSVPRSDI